MRFNYNGRGVRMSLDIDLNTISLEQIENIKVEKQKEKQEKEQNYDIVKLEKLQIEREIINLDGRKKDLAITLSKAMSVLKDLKADIEILESTFWSRKRGM